MVTESPRAGWRGGFLIFAALRAAPLFSCRRYAAAGQLVLHLARDLRGPGLRAYFCHTTKVGKNVLKPTV